MRPRVPGATIVLLARLLDQLMVDDSTAADDGGGTHAWTAGAAVRGIDSGVDNTAEERTNEFAKQAAMLYSLLAEVLPDRRPPPLGVAVSLLGTIARNAHTICDEELEPIGIGLYPLAAMTNHDCDPNASQSFDGHTLVLRALRTIEQGDEISIGCN